MLANYCLQLRKIIVNWKYAGMLTTTYSDYRYSVYFKYICHGIILCKHVYAHNPTFNYTSQKRTIVGPFWIPVIKIFHVLMKKSFFDEKPEKILLIVLDANNFINKNCTNTFYIYFKYYILHKGRINELNFTTYF